MDRRLQADCPTGPCWRLVLLIPVIDLGEVCLVEPQTLSLIKRNKLFKTIDRWHQIRRKSKRLENNFHESDDVKPL